MGSCEQGGRNEEFWEVMMQHLALWSPVRHHFFLIDVPVQHLLLHPSYCGYKVPLSPSFSQIQLNAHLCRTKPRTDTHLNFFQELRLKQLLILLKQPPGFWHGENCAITHLRDCHLWPICMLACRFSSLPSSVDKFLHQINDDGGGIWHHLTSHTCFPFFSSF